MKIIDSSTFQFCALVLTVSAIAATNGVLLWSEWLDQAVILVGVYASKEGIRYGASAYQNKT